MNAKRTYQQTEPAPAATPSPDGAVATRIAQEAEAVYERVKEYLETHPLEDPATLESLRDEATRAYSEMDKLLRTESLAGAGAIEGPGTDGRRLNDAQGSLESKALRELERLKALIDQVEDTRQRSEAFYNSARLPEPETIRALAAAHAEYIRELEAEFGPPSQEDIENAKRLKAELFGDV